MLIYYLLQKGEMGTFELMDKQARQLASELHGMAGQAVKFVRGESKVRGGDVDGDDSFHFWVDVDRRCGSLFVG